MVEGGNGEDRRGRHRPSQKLLLGACGLDALPTDEAGTGRTEELEKALALHDLHLPADASNISYTVHASIDSHAVGVRFSTTSEGLDELLTSLGSSQLDLQDGMNPWATSSRLSSHSPERYSWDLTSIPDHAGLEVPSSTSLGASGVLVDLADPAAPVVYVEVLDCC